MLINEQLNICQKWNWKFAGFTRSNFLGTHFTTYDSGESPSHSGFVADINNIRRELVAVTFVRLLSLCYVYVYVMLLCDWLIVTNYSRLRLKCMASLAKYV